MKILNGYGLEIGVSNGGHIHLEQLDGIHQETQVILLNKHEAKILIAELRKLIKMGVGEIDVDGE